jgi:aryl-alcohol dehydrogenase-like predicted oxidoreductase
MAETVQLGRTELRVSRLGLGVMIWGEASGAQRFMPAKSAYGGTNPADEQAAFDASLAAEINFFDTAAMYSAGASERRLGELADGKDVVIATKFPPTPLRRADDLPDALDASLRNLQSSSVDLYQHHFPSRRVDIDELMGRMADAVEAGKIKAVGVSNYSAGQMRTAYQALARRGIPLASNQVQYSLLHRQPETNGVLDTCRELGITLIAYQPLASGALTGKYLDSQPVGIRRFREPFRGAQFQALRPVVTLLRSIGDHYGKTPGQVALRWLLQQESVVPIPGARNADQVIHNAGALSFTLTAEEMAYLDEATQAWRTYSWLMGSVVRLRGR